MEPISVKLDTDGVKSLLVIVDEFPIRLISASAPVPDNEIELEDEQTVSANGISKVAFFCPPLEAVKRTSINVESPTAKLVSGQVKIEKSDACVPPIIKLEVSIITSCCLSFFT